MDLASPSALWLLALLPLLLLARRRQPRSRLRVSHLPFWTAAATTLAAAPAKRIRRDWLLILQAAFLLALVVALAGPQVPLPGHGTAIVIDVSMSMAAREGAGSRLDAARRRALDAAEQLPRGTRVHLLTAAGAVVDVGTFGSRQPGLRDAMAAIRTTGSHADLSAAIQRARQLTPTPERVIVVSDDEPDERTAGDSGVEWIRVGRPADNLAVRTIATRPDADGRTTTLVEVRNFGGTPAQATIAIAQGSTELFRGAVAIPAHGQARISPVLSLPPGQIVTASIEHGDALAADDVRSAVVSLPETLWVELRDGTPLLERALSSRPGVNVVRTTAREERPAPPSGVDVVVCNGCVKMPEGEGGVILLPSNVSQQGLARTDETSGAPLLVRDNVLGVATALDGSLVDPIAAVRPSNERGIVATAAGVPVILAYELGRRRVVEFRFNPETSPLSKTAGFPLLMAAALDWSKASGRNATTVTAGTMVRWVSASNAVSVTGPDNQTAGAETRNGSLFFRPEVGGVYQVQSGSTRQSLVANPNVDEESDLAAVTTASASGSLQRPEGALLTDVTRWVALAALVLLALEWRVRQQRIRSW